MRVQDWADCNLWKPGPCPWRMKRKKGKEREEDDQPADDELKFLFGHKTKEEAKAQPYLRLVSAAEEIGFRPNRIRPGDAIAALVLALAALAAGRISRGVVLTPRALRGMERAVSRVARFRGPQGMTGGRGGWHVNMSQLGRPIKQTRSVRMHELRRLHGDFGRGGHPGN